MQNNVFSKHFNLVFLLNTDFHQLSVQKLKLTFLVLLLLPSDGKTEIKDCEIIADINCFRMPL